MSYTATEFDSVSDKERFEHQFKTFALSDFPRTKFPKWFYNRLSNCFGFIAHYNIQGFYDTYFTNAGDKVRFIDHILQWSCVGDPAFTYSDVERQLKKWLDEQKLLDRYQKHLLEVEGLSAKLQLTLPEWNRLVADISDKTLYSKVVLQLHQQGLVETKTRSPS